MRAANRRRLLGALTVAGLLASAPLGARAAETAHTWRHGAILAKSDSGFFFMVNHGFAEKQGLKLKIVQFRTDILALQALIAGEIDSFEGGPGGSMVANSHGGDLRVLGCDWPGLSYGIFTPMNIASVEDLKEKTFAISAPAANPAVVAYGILEKYGVPKSSVHFANLGGDLDRFKAVVAGVAAGAIVSDEYQPIAKKQGIKMLIDAHEALPDYVRQCIMTSQNVLKTKRDDAVRFMAAEMEAWHYAVTHRDETLKLTRETANIKPDDPRPEFVYDRALKEHSVDPDLSIPTKKLQWMSEQLVKDGSLKQPVDLSTFTDPSIRTEALALLKEKK